MLMTGNLGVLAIIVGVVAMLFSIAAILVSNSSRIKKLEKENEILRAKQGESGGERGD